MIGLRRALAVFLFVSFAPMTALRAADVQLFDNGPFVTHPGGGAGGADASALQTALGLGTYGHGWQFGLGYRIADDFTVPASGWIVNSIVLYGYQTNSTTTSTITSVNYRIWNGPPGSPGSSVVFGDTTTNRLMTGSFSNTYRVLDTELTSAARPVMQLTLSAGLQLHPGTYWLDVQADGSLSSGPWYPPISILGQMATGNALQYTTSWDAIVDAGAQQGIPFKLLGTSVASSVPVPVLGGWMLALLAGLLGLGAFAGLNQRP
jgi:hypothetical protein